MVNPTAWCSQAQALPLLLLRLIQPGDVELLALATAACVGMTVVTPVQCSTSHPSTSTAMILIAHARLPISSHAQQNMGRAHSSANLVAPHTQGCAACGNGGDGGTHGCHGCPHIRFCHADVTCDVPSSHGSQRVHLPGCSHVDHHDPVQMPGAPPVLLQPGQHVVG